MLKFKQVELTAMDEVSGMLSHKKAEFFTPYFYCAISVVHMDDGRRWPWLTVLQNERNSSVLLGQTYQCFTEEEALNKAEELWQKVRDSLIAYLQKH